MKELISFCKSCYCMTKTLVNEKQEFVCGKCRNKK